MPRDDTKFPRILAELKKIGLRAQCLVVSEAVHGNKCQTCSSNRQDRDFKEHDPLRLAVPFKIMNAAAAVG